jgi:hypothetical protein
MPAWGCTISRIGVFVCSFLNICTCLTRLAVVQRREGVRGPSQYGLCKQQRLMNMGEAGLYEHVEQQEQLHRLRSMRRGKWKIQ